MDNWKIELFKKENEDASLEIRAVSSIEAKSFYDNLCQKMGYHNLDHNKRSMYEFLQQEGNHVNGCDALSSDFEISVLLEPYHLIETYDIIIIWDDLGSLEMDLMPFETFKNHFFDIWYPASDDMIFCNDKQEFVYLVRHDGMLFKMSLSS